MLPWPVGCSGLSFLPFGASPVIEELTGGCYTNRAVCCICVLYGLMPSQEMDRYHSRRGKESKEISHRRWRVNREKRLDEKEIKFPPQLQNYYFFNLRFGLYACIYLGFAEWLFLVSLYFYLFLFFTFVIVCLFWCSKTCQSLMRAMSVSCCLKTLYWPVFPILYNLSVITMADS